MQMFHNDPERSTRRKEKYQLSPSLEACSQISVKLQLLEKLYGPLATEVTMTNFATWWEMYDHCLKIDFVVERKGFSYENKAYKITSTDFRSVDSTVTTECARKTEVLNVFSRRFVDMMKNIQ